MPTLSQCDLRQCADELDTIGHELVKLEKRLNKVCAKLPGEIVGGRIDTLPGMQDFDGFVLGMALVKLAEEINEDCDEQEAAAADDEPELPFAGTDAASDKRERV